MKRHFGLTIVLLFALLGASFALAQTASAPELIISWQANSYNSPGYAGKVLATPESTFRTEITLLDKGRVVDLEPYEIRWFLNGSLLKSGQGIDDLLFKLSPFTNTADLKVVVRNYNKLNIEKSTQIQLASPKIIINSPSEIPLKGAITVRALYYSIPGNDLGGAELIWSLNNGGQTRTIAEDNF